jgi:hypothetical protein
VSDQPCSMTAKCGPVVQPGRRRVEGKDRPVAGAFEYRRSRRGVGPIENAADLAGLVDQHVQRVQIQVQQAVRCGRSDDWGIAGTASSPGGAARPRPAPCRMPQRSPRWRACVTDRQVRSRAGRPGSRARSKPARARPPASVNSTASSRSGTGTAVDAAAMASTSRRRVLTSPVRKMLSPHAQVSRSLRRQLRATLELTHFCGHIVCVDHAARSTVSAWRASNVIGGMLPIEV